MYALVAGVDKYRIVNRVKDPGKEQC